MDIDAERLRGAEVVAGVEQLGVRRAAERRGGEHRRGFHLHGDAAGVAPAIDCSPQFQTQ